ARGPAPRPHRQPDRPRGRLARRGLGRGRARPLRHRGRLQPRRGEAVPAGAAVGVSSGSVHVNEGGMGPSPDDLALLAARRARFLEKARQAWHTVRRDDPLAQRLMALIRRAQEMHPRTGTGPTTIRDPGDLLHEMRLRKEPAELARMREAIAIACDAHREAMRTARPGMYEYEIEAL